jgi:hypothetical protein
VLVLDANNEFVTATAGYGNLIIQVLGDTLDEAGRSRRTAERTGVATSPPAQPEARARQGGAGSGARPRSGGSGVGGGAAGVSSREGRELPPGEVRLSQWRGTLMNFRPRDRGDSVFSLGGGPHGYVAGITYQRGPSRSTGDQPTSPFNTAPGLHPLPSNVRDDSAIDGIPASSLTSLETFTLRGEVNGRPLTVVVVTTKGDAR